MLRAGNLNHRIALQAPQQTDTALGDTTIVYATDATVWANVSPASGRKGYIARQVRPDVTHIVTIRRHPGITARWRAVYQGRTLNLGPPMDTGELRVEQTFFAVEIVA